MGRKKKDTNILDDKAKNKLTCELLDLMKAYVLSKDQIPTGRPSHRKQKKQLTTKSENPVSKTQPAAPANSKSRNKVIRKCKFQDFGQPVHRQNDNCLKRLDRTWSTSSCDNGALNLRLTQSEAIREALFRTRNDILLGKMGKINIERSWAAIPTPKPFDRVTHLSTRKNCGLPRPLPSRNRAEISSQTKIKPRVVGKRKRKGIKLPMTVPNSMDRIPYPCRTFKPTFNEQNNEFFKPTRTKHKEIHKNSYPPIMTCRKLPVLENRRTLAEFDARMYPVTERIQKYVATDDQVKPPSNAKTCKSLQPLVMARAYWTGIGGHDTLQMINPKPNSRFKVYDFPGLKPPEVHSDSFRPKDQRGDHWQDISYAKPQLQEIVQEILRYKAEHPEFASEIQKIQQRSAEMVQHIPDVRAQVAEYDFSHLKTSEPDISYLKAQSSEYLIASSSSAQPPVLLESIPKLKTFSAELVQHCISTQTFSSPVADSRSFIAIPSGDAVEFASSASIAQAFQVGKPKAIPIPKWLRLAKSPVEINRSSRTKTVRFSNFTEEYESISPRICPYSYGMDEGVEVEQTELPDMLEHLDPTKIPKIVAHPKTGFTLPEVFASKEIPNPPSESPAPSKLSLGQRFSQAVLKLFPRRSSCPNLEDESQPRPITTTSKNAFGLLETVRLDLGINTQGNKQKPILQRTPSTGMLLKRVYGVMDLTRDDTQVEPATMASKKKQFDFSNMSFATEEPVKRDHDHSRPCPRESTPFETYGTDSSDRKWLLRDFWQGTRIALNRENRVLPMPLTQTKETQTRSKNL